MKWTRNELHEAYVLHTRPYRETSLLIEAYTRSFGRVSLIAKGVRQPKSKWRGLLQPFVPLLISWMGKTELYTATNVEGASSFHLLTGDRLLCGLYVNELLLRVLHREDSHPSLFDAYVNLLNEFASSSEIQSSLRLFEKKLLQEMGYAFSLTHDCKTAHPISKEKHYCFDPSQGLFQSDAFGQDTFSGISILALAENNLEKEHLRETKRLLRLALLPIIGDKPLRSRELFIL